MLLTPEVIQNSPIVAKAASLRLELKDYRTKPEGNFGGHGFVHPSFPHSELVYNNPRLFLKEMLEAPTLSERWNMVVKPITKKYIDYTQVPRDVITWGPEAKIGEWAEPMIEAVYASGFTQGRLKKLIDHAYGNKEGISTATIWRHGSGQLYGETYQEKVGLLHETSKLRKTEFKACGWWARFGPFAMQVYLLGDINQVIVDHYQEIAERSQVSPRQGTLSFALA